MGELNRVADVVIIGGGCMGVSTACFLAQRGVSVVLVEKKYLASGPTGQSSAVIRQHYSIEQLVRTSLQSLKIFQNFDELIGGNPGFIKTGWLFLSDQEYAPTLEKLVNVQKKLGVNVKLISPDDLKNIQPQTNVEDISSISYHPDSGYANPVATTNLLAESARRYGAHIYEDTAVTGIDVNRGKIQSVITTKGDIHAPIVLNAAGAWGAKISDMVGVELPIGPTRHQVIIFKKPYNYWQPAMIYADIPQNSYYRPHEDDMFLVGAANEVFGHDKVDPQAYNSEADRETFQWALDRFKYRFPVMKNALFRGGYSAVYDTTPDEQPIIGAVEEIEGFYCLLGWSGHGFKHSPAMGQLMAELIIDGSTSEVDLSIFSHSRFRKGCLNNAKEF
jgi:sarcosine oxidase subunit beta